MNNYSFLIQKNDDNKRLSSIDLEQIPNVFSKSKWKKTIQNNLVKINNKNTTTATFVHTGDLIQFSLPEATNHKVFKLKLDVLFEDEYLAVIYKPAGFSVSGNSFKTIQNALEFNLKVSDKMLPTDQFKTCHRLDNQTSGLLIISKTDNVRMLIGKAFEEKKISKKYLAIVHNNFIHNFGEWTNKIENKNALSTYKILESFQSIQFGNLNLIELEPKTGRTHQLRIHCSSNKHPILGDKLYNKEYTYSEKGLFLSAVYLKFKHPILDKYIDIKTEIPNKFTSFIKRENRRFIQNKN